MVDKDRPQGRPSRTRSVPIAANTFELLATMTVASRPLQLIPPAGGVLFRRRDRLVSQPVSPQPFRSFDTKEHNHGNR